jgi:hypothetical protein
VIEENIKDFVFKYIQEVFRTNPVIILGSGASCACGLSGMAQLGTYLNEKLSTENEFQEEWAAIYSNIGEGLESALQKKEASEGIVNQISELTADYIRREDRALFRKIIDKQVNLPITTIIEFLFSGHIQSLTIITTNYDCIAEYACDLAEVPYTTGFSGGYFKQFSIERCASLYDRTITRNISKTRKRIVNEVVPHVEILKLHGSVDWFQDRGFIFSISVSDEVSNSFKSLVVAPGLRKYLETHYNPYREIISLSDSAIQHGTSFFIIGYGFNDQHLEELLRPKLQNIHNKVVVLAKELTKSAKQLLIGNKNILIITENKTSRGTWCYMDEKEYQFEESFWVLSEFVKILTGGIK